MYMERTKGGMNPRGNQPQSNLQTTTVRSFEGGLNVADTDLNMSPKYARILDNIERQTDGSLAVRPGTVLLSNHMWDAGSNIINHTYFNAVVVAVQATGAWTKVQANGAGTHMELVGAAAGTRPWTASTDYASFTVFNSNLIGCNGRNKPIIVKGDPNDPNYMAAAYMVDEATGSNINVPVGKYVVAHGQYLVIAGVPSSPSTIYVSAKGTYGTFVGAPAPNDGISLDLGPRVSLGSSEITGLVAYRDKLLVTFERGVLPLNLGVYTGSPTAVHTPTDDGFIEEFGCMCHRSLVSVGDDTFFNDNIGVNSINRVNVFNTLRPIRASHLVDPMTTDAIQPLTVAQIQQYMFAVYDLRNFRYMLFVPVFSGSVLQETICFSYTNIPTLKIQAWARLRGWKWQSACRTSLQNIIFSSGDKLYAYDFDNVDQCVDFRNDTTINGGNGVPVTFDWEMPWTDLKHRMLIKEIRYLQTDTLGAGLFTVRAYVDNIYNYLGSDSPLLTMNFVGGSAAGYGRSPYGSTAYGGGRRAADERLYAFTAKFKLLKLRFSGTTEYPLRFISISLAYMGGSIRR